jgi:Ca-activated chloride channel homolog
MRRLFIGVLGGLLTFWFAGCSDSKVDSNSSEPNPLALRIISGSENESLAPLLEEFSRATGHPVEIKYKGSVDIMLELQKAESVYDAVWPANSLWIELSGNKNVRHSASISRSPVVIGIRQGKAKELGLSLGQGLKFTELVRWAQQKKVSFLMSNPTQSNSGAMAYLGFLHGAVGQEDAITASDLEQPQVRAQTKSLLQAIARTSGSSGWLADLYVESAGQYDAMINYEMTLIETNQKLAAKGLEPLLIFYPEEGQPIADSTLGFWAKPENVAKETVFLDLQKFLLTPEIQSRLGALGRRTGLLGLTTGADSAVFKPEWGLQANRVLQPVPLPSAAVIRQALVLYQTVLKKPSFTLFVLDYSGSMMGGGEEQLESAMTLLLTPEKAAPYFLQTGEEDITVVLPFDAQPRLALRLIGNKPADMAGFLNQTLGQSPGGGTNIYAAAARALSELPPAARRTKYQTSLVLLTDGKSQGSVEEFLTVWEKDGTAVPVFSIMFGKADPQQLEVLAQRTAARVFDGRKDLIAAFRNAKGYN